VAETLRPLTDWFRRLIRPLPPHPADARPRHAAALARLHAASFHRGWDEEEFLALLADPAVIGDVMGSTAGGARTRDIHGFILSRIAADEAEILSVAVARRRRGRGLAGTLLAFHMRRLAGLGVRHLFLEVDEANRPALALYRRAGFREVGRRPGYYAGADGHAVAALVMRRDLT